MNGAVYVAYGDPARAEARASIASLQAACSVPVAVVSDHSMEMRGVKDIYHPDADPGGRLAKLELDRLSPYDQTIYIDADTRVRQDVTSGFRILASGWDMAISLSRRQGMDWLGNISQEDRILTATSLGVAGILALQAGVFFFRRCRAVIELFAAWRDEWKVLRQKDQGALLRALWQFPLRIWLLSPDWNSGSIVEHRFGKARR